MVFVLDLMCAFFFAYEKRSRDELVCVLRGSWVQTARQMIVDASERMDHVFVYLRYVLLDNPVSPDPALVVSWMDASTLRVDPKISFVQAMKEAMLDDGF